jgi:hypothetical protein
MERFRRNVSPPDSSRIGLAGNGDSTTTPRKRPSISRTAENFQSKLIASFKSVRRRGDDLAQDKKRYVDGLIDIWRLCISAGFDSRQHGLSRQ